MHIGRLEEVFKLLGIAARGKACEGMKGLIEDLLGQTLEEEKEADEKLTTIAGQINPEAETEEEEEGQMAMAASRATSGRGSNGGSRKGTSRRKKR